MDCREVRDALLRGEIPEGPEVQAHLGGCPACNALLADQAALGQRLGQGEPLEPAFALTSLLAEVEQSLGRERGVRAWLRSLSTPWRIACALGSVGVVAAFVLVYRPRPDLSAYPIDRMALTVAFYALLIGGAFALELRPLQRRALPRWVRPVLAGIALLVPVAFAFAPSAEVVAVHVPGSFMHLALGCFMFGLALTVPVLVLLFSLDRRAHRSFGVVVLAAAAGGLVANLGLALHCPITNVAHVLVGHATIGLILIMVYVLAFSWSTRRTQRKIDSR